MSTIVISGVNLTEGGILSILQDCLKALKPRNLLTKHKVIVFVHSKDFVREYINDFEIIEYPLVKTSWFKRLNFEYVESKKLSKEIKPDYWISLHDMTPNVICKTQVVYCHNPSPFIKLTVSEQFKDIKFALFNAFYKYLYGINIKRNKFVIIQQTWLREEFYRRYKVDSIVAHPHIESNLELEKLDSAASQNKFLIFYPAFPRIFKNFEVLLKAAELLSKKRDDFEVVITITGQENTYSKELFENYSKYKFIKFVGKISRKEVYSYYSDASCLAFPSRLETWGLPLSEFKSFNKPILSANLPYAKETIGEYKKVKFFEPNDPNQLSEYLDLLIEKRLNFDGNKAIVPAAPFAQNWDELFNLILNEN